ncbi:growth/differentiation factor 8-like [Diadema antillarum]|uniref:growth/differentiation factor 8-like n=2 Tax=Diadema antillarum TaxID=105358 RepID=UPI003A871167
MPCLKCKGLDIQHVSSLPNNDTIFADSSFSLLPSQSQSGISPSGSNADLNSTDISPRNVATYVSARPERRQLLISQDRHAQYEMVRRKILSQLGMDRPPTAEEIARANISQEQLQEMYRLYYRSVQQLATRDHNQRDPNFVSPTYVNHIYSFKSADNPPMNASTNEWYSSGNLRVYIPMHFPTIIPRTVYKATLQLYLVPPSLPPSDGGVNIRIYQLLSPLRKGIRTPRRLIASTEAPLSQQGWLFFPVKEAAVMWLSNPSVNFGFEVVCDVMFSKTLIFSGNVHGRTIYSNDGEEWIPRIDIVVRETTVSTIAQRRRRRRRSDVDIIQPICDPEEHVEGCCKRYNFTISFSELGYDWILAPLEYNAYFCAGECPHLYNVANTHAMIRALMRKIDPASSPQPCCNPSALSVLPVLHYLRTRDGRISATLTPMEDMVVDQCRCS